MPHPPKASFWLYQPDDVVLYHRTSELNRHPVSESGAGRQPERYHTRLAAGTHYSKATVVLLWIATAQNSRGCFAWRKRRSSLIVPGEGLVEHRVRGDALPFSTRY